jgi:aminomethyltransferase
MLIDMRLHKSPFWHLSQEQGAWCYSVYNKFYHPRAYVKPEDGGLMQEYKWLTEDVTMWNVAVERQTCVKGPDAERFTDELITRRAGLCKVGHCKYVILCNPAGGILNDPVLLRPSEDEFWLSLADSDITMYAQGLNYGLKMNVEITEIDVAPVQIQGPKSTALMVDLCGPEIEAMPYYGLLHSTVGGCPVVISRTGFSAERGYEIYLYNATVNAEKMWYAVLEAGENTTCTSSRPDTTGASRQVSSAMARTWTSRRTPSRLASAGRLILRRTASWARRRSRRSRPKASRTSSAASSSGGSPSLGTRRTSTT